MIYRIFRLIWRFALSIFFRRIEVDGLEHVPENGAILLVPNHTNAFVDPLVILVNLSRPVTLTAKSVLRRNPLLRLIIKYFNIIELHRRQDIAGGADPLKNQDAFAECRRRLKSGAAICIFPEGVSHSDASLRRFKHGAARLAIEYTRENPNSNRLMIVPVGIDYEAKAKMRSSVWVRFDHPIDVVQWLQTEEVPTGDALTNLLEERVRSLSRNHRTKREALLFNWTAEVYATRGQSPEMLGRNEVRHANRVHLIERLQAAYYAIEPKHPEKITDLIDRLRAYRSELGRWGVTVAEVFLPLSIAQAAFFVLREVELLVVGTPIVIVGVIQHALPWVIVRRIAVTFSKDHDHWASNVIVPSLVVWPLLLSIESTIVGLTASWTWAAMFLAVSPFTLLYATLWRERTGGAWSRTRSFLLFVTNRSTKAQLEAEGQDIIKIIDRTLAEAEMANKGTSL